MIPRLRAMCTAVAIAALLVARPLAAQTLPHLRGIDEIRDWFNSGNGHVRVILLLSPT